MLKFNKDITVYCINLKTRPDRKERIQKQFDTLGLDVIWWEVEKHSKGGVYGCFESHWNIWKRNEGKTVMIFEDDIFFKGSPEEFYETVNNGLKLINKYDLVQLGNHPVSRKRRVYKNFYEGNFLNLECYLSTGKSLRRLADELAPYFGIHIDVLTATLAKQVGTFPSPFEQDYFDTDNQWCHKSFDGIARKLNTNNKDWMIYVPDFAKGVCARWMMRNTDLAKLINSKGGNINIAGPQYQN